MLFRRKENFAEEEGVKIPKYSNKISKEQEVFFNPTMKINRDISMLIIKNYFDKKVKFCDPMVASGIREIRFLKKIPSTFESLTLGDISKNAIQDCKRNFKINKISTKKINFINSNAINTINSDFFDFIEVDPFGSPVPFLDVAVQKIKHNGILSITATDTAALCGTYPKTCERKYGIKVLKTHYHEELGLRNLIAYSIIEGAKYGKSLTPIVSFTNQHFFKVFLKVEESKTKSLENIKKLSWISWDKKSQITKIERLQNKDSIGKTYTGELNDKKFLRKILDKVNLIEDKREIEKLIIKLIEEENILGYINPHKLEKEYKFPSKIKFEKLVEEIKKKKYKVSRVHNDKYGIKTNTPTKIIISIMKKY